MACAGCGNGMRDRHSFRLPEGRPSESEIQYALERWISNPMRMQDNSLNLSSKVWRYCFDLFVNTHCLTRSKMIPCILCVKCEQIVSSNSYLTQIVDNEWAYILYLIEKYKMQILQGQQKIDEAQQAKITEEDRIQNERIADFQHRQATRQPQAAYPLTQPSQHHSQYQNPSSKFFGFPQIPFC